MRNSDDDDDGEDFLKRRLKGHGVEMFTLKKGHSSVLTDVDVDVKEKGDMSSNLGSNSTAQCTTAELLTAWSSSLTTTRESSATTSTTASTATATAGTGSLFTLESVGHTLCALLESLLVGTARHPW